MLIFKGDTYMCLKLNFAIAIFLFAFAFSNPSFAKNYFNYDAENDTAGESLPHSIFQPYHNWDKLRGQVISDPTTPQGNNIVLWEITEKQNHDMLNYVPFNTVPQLNPGSTYYYAFLFRFDRIDGQDIWWDQKGDDTSFDKFAEIKGKGFRWIIEVGEIYMANQDHRFSVLVWDGQRHNPEVVWDGYYWENHNGYSKKNSIQLEYEKWHSAVFSVRLATDKMGEIGLWINGIKVVEYLNIITMSPGAALGKMMWNGTIAQSAYDAPPHYRKVDAIIFTDDWQDIIDGGYLDNNDDEPTSTPQKLIEEYELQDSEKDELQRIETPYKSPEVVWLPQGADLTKHTKGPFTVKIQVEGIDKQKNPSIYPRIRYFIGTGNNYGYFDMIHEGDVIWRFDIPDPKWYNCRSKSLRYQVKVFDEEGNAIIESRWQKELIDSFIQKN